MTVENYLAEAGALAGLAGVLAGFSLAAVVQLLTSNNGGRLTTAGSWSSRRPRSCSFIH